ncbi:hypothetical protein ACFLZB_00525 [Nanoarchaeota archaeon]
MQTDQQRHEDILQDIVRARNKIATGNGKSALEILAGVQTELHNYHGHDRTYMLLLMSYDKGIECASIPGSPAEIKESQAFRDFQKYLGMVVKVIKPAGMTELADRTDDHSSTRPY